ncbi:hypothetical protein FH972_008681 [Carpinus fangiana]|uniref:Uncharacterized protein n=1 Tax=Carpinus fangiana TaxID=176857 RepID=A0A5N6R132_9ROSI|nr:hypothetical protein FH972_008681 [Carpinus fangiana]
MASLLLLLSQLVRPQATTPTILARLPPSSSSSASASCVAAAMRFTAQMPPREEAIKDNTASEEMLAENPEEYRVCIESVWP